MFESSGFTVMKFSIKRNNSYITNIIRAKYFLIDYTHVLNALES